jgi:hypothetical protein
LQIYSSWPHAGAAGPREHRRISSSGHGKTLARSLLNEHVDPAIRLEGDSELAAAEISFVSSPNMISGANCYHAARRVRDHPYLAWQLSDCGIWLAYWGANPCGLVVRQGDESKERNGYASIAHKNYDETQGKGDFILVRASGE